MRLALVTWAAFALLLFGANAVGHVLANALALALGGAL